MLIYDQISFYFVINSLVHTRKAGPLMDHLLALYAKDAILQFYD